MENQNLEQKSDCQCDDNCQCGDKCNCSSKTTIFTIILLIVIAILLASAGLYYFLQDKEPVANDLPQMIIEEAQADEPLTDEPLIEEPITEEPIIEEPPLIEPPMAIPYSHSTYNFALTFPGTWEGYISTSRNIEWGAPIGTTDSIDFGFAAQDSIFNISIFTPAQWTALQTLGGPMPSYLGENSQYVFAYDMSQFAANDDMDARRNEVSNITRTFRLQ